jgi:hypothetical protein
VGIQPATTDDITTRRGKGDLTTACEHRRGQKNGCTNLSAELRVELRGPHGLRVDQQRVPLLPLRADAGRPDQFNKRLDVPDARHILESHRLVHEERGGDDGKRGILVPRWADGAGERVPAFYDILQCGYERSVNSRCVTAARMGRIVSTESRDGECEG